MLFLSLVSWNQPLSPKEVQVSLLDKLNNPLMEYGSRSLRSSGKLQRNTRHTKITSLDHQRDTGQDANFSLRCQFLSYSFPSFYFLLPCITGLRKKRY